MADTPNSGRKVRLELLDGTVEVTGSEEFLRRAQALFIRLATTDSQDLESSSVALPEIKPFEEAGVPPPRAATDVRSLKDQKQPRNVVEMAAIVAYYVANMAPEAERKDTITAQDITKLFGQAGYSSTTQPRMILFQAKNAGYLDSPTVGEYKLNPVGYNLVTAGLPADSASAPRRRRASSQRGGPKKKTKK